MRDKRHFVPLICTLLLLLTLQSVVAFNELQGTHLTGCVLEESPYVVRDENRISNYSGVALDYLARLQENLNFSISLLPWEDTWSRFIDHMALCDPSGVKAQQCKCNIGVGSFTMTNARAEMINFVWPLGNEAHRMVGRKADLRVDDSQNTWFVFQTFSIEVWGFILLGILMHTIGTVFFGPFRPPDFKQTNNLHPATARRSNRAQGIMWQLKRFPAAMLFSYAHLIGHPFGERAQGTPSFHRTAWMVLGVTTGLFLLTIYEASLTVLLFESTRTSPFRTLRDIQDCAVSPAKVAMIRGGASQEFWNLAVNTTDRRKKCKDWDRVGFTVSNLEEGFTALRNGTADFYYSLEGSVLFRAHRNCEEFEPVGEPFFSTSVGFVMPKNRNGSEDLLDILSRETRKLREQDGFESASLLASRNSCEAETDATITSGKLWAFFVLYAISWFFLLSYRCVFLWRRKSAGTTDEQTPPQDGKPEEDAGNNKIVIMDMHSMPTRGITGLAIKDHTYDPFDEYPRSSLSYGSKIASST